MAVSTGVARGCVAETVEESAVTEPLKASTTKELVEAGFKPVTVKDVAEEPSVPINVDCDPLIS